MIISYGTDSGLVRPDNQDTLFTKQISDDTALFIIADGMGGHHGGKTASKIAIKLISKHILKGIMLPQSEENIMSSIIESVNYANDKIFSESLKNIELNGMGTTAVIALVINEVLYVANVGDSRLYVLSNGILKQITNDHSYVERLVEKGLITSEEAKSHPQKNIITRAVGSDRNVETDIFKYNIKKDDIIFLCSDGLSDMVSDTEIKKCLHEGIVGCADRLISLANEHGGRDNISVIAVKFN